MISLIFMTVFIVYATKFFLDDDKDNPWAFLLALQIAISYCIAVFWALYPKMYWAFASRQKEGTRRFSYYLVSTLITIGCVFIIRVLVLGVKTGGITHIFGSLMTYMPWQIPSAALVLLLCYFLDSRTVLISRWFEGVVGAVVMCMAFAMASHLVNNPTILYDYSFPFLVGFMVFSYVPYWYRNSISQADETEPVIQEADHGHLSPG
jgi:hypothetical protein